MEYKILDNGIEIIGKDCFNIVDILECGQIFSYVKCDDGYSVYSFDKRAKVVERENGYKIITDDAEYFENFFDLKTDYAVIMARLKKYPLLKSPIEFGGGIRILKQNLFETLISFIVSANNNIKRIQLILFRLREALGKDMGDYHAFPSRESLLEKDEAFFKSIGAGYRASYLYKVVRQVDEKTLVEWKKLPTSELRRKLIGLSGVGPKVADCVLLFGYGRGDVFPVDTWIAKMYNKYYTPLENREEIRRRLTDEFGEDSGYAQQYLFYYMRSESG